MSFPDLITEVLIRDIEGGVGKIKGDEPTVFGLSSNFYADFVNSYFAAAKAGDKREMERLREVAKAIYIRDYLRVIPGSAWMEDYFPGLLALLFFGRVHGAGYMHYTKAVQRWLKMNIRRNIVIDGRFGPMTLAAVKETSAEQRVALVTYLKSGNVVDLLTQQRIASVAAGGVVGVDRGLRNRILKELDVATALNKDSFQYASDGVKNLVITYARTPDVRAKGSEGNKAPIINLV